MEISFGPGGERLHSGEPEDTTRTREGRYRPAAASRRHFMYFHMRGLPSAIHAIAVSRRLVRVVSVRASVIHSMYSRRWLGLKSSKVALAFRFFRSAAARSGGTASGGFGLRFERVGDGMPASLKAAAFRT